MPDACASPGAPEVDQRCRENIALVQHEVTALAARLPRHVLRDDLVSAGMAALLAAARSFDPSLGVPFARFAARRIRGALLDELRTADWASRAVRSRSRSYDVAHDVLAARLGRTPTVVELAAHLRVAPAELEGMRVDVHRSVVLSVEALTPHPAADAMLPVAADTPESVLMERERRGYLHAAIEALPERLRAVVVGYFLHERPMRELAEELGVTESRISQLRAEALTLLRDGMNTHLDPELVEPVAAPGVAARRREAYYAAVAGKSSYHARLSTRRPDPATLRSA